MNSENIIIGTWLPVFPGFYGTYFDGEVMYESEENYIEEHVKPEALAAVMIENFHNSNAGTKLWKDYTESTAKQCVKLIEKELKHKGFVESIKFEEISSPKFYNFSNDSINIEVVFSAENIQAIRHFVSEHFAEWKTYLKETYTSCSGFMSHHSNVPGAEEWFVDNALNDKHNAGSILEFLCGELKINSEFLYYQVDNNVSIDIEALKKECLELGWYEPNTRWNRFKSWLKDNLPKYHVMRSASYKQYILDTSKQKYIFAVYKGDITNNTLIAKRYFKRFVFARLKDEKGEKN